MNALIFPGQGSQVVGMGAEFYDKFEIVKKIFNQADEKLGFSLSNLILNGPTNELQLTKNTQPAILTVSYSIFSVLRNEFKFDFKNFKYFAGHSLGEYSALVCSEAINFSDAVYLLHERGKAMQESVPVGEGSMLAVIGVNIKDLNELIKNLKDIKGTCEIANDNAFGQVILSGDKKSIEALQFHLKEKKIKTIQLNVSAPFHFSLIKPAAEIMRNKINNTKFNDPLFPIINNVTAEPENNPSKIKSLLIDQIFSTVRWRESVINMSQLGVKKFIEVGPGKVLSGMIKRTIKDVKCFSINSIADIEGLQNEFKK
jgi:[acyl-carrier-protein] S-malonyltransferase